jgi:hypothetical protein
VVVPIALAMNTSNDKKTISISYLSPRYRLTLVKRNCGCIILQ